MIRGLIHTLLVCFFLGLPMEGACASRVQKNALGICSAIIMEMTEGRVKTAEADEICLRSQMPATSTSAGSPAETCGSIWPLCMWRAASGSESSTALIARGFFRVHAPSWARKFGLKYKDLLDLETNADSGVRVFKSYLDLYENLVPTLSTYNSDHPSWATGYARTVIATRNRIKKRFTELFREQQKVEEGPRADVSH